MARKPRIHYPGAVYHVMLRGNGGADVFFADADRYRFFLLLQQGIERFGFRVHAYCLMSNHIHLALQVGKIPLSRIMQNLSFRYTQWINWRTKRHGHLFQGRYKAVLVEEDEYLLQLVAYLHLNPLRAGMVESPADYRWSGHRAYMGQEQIPWLSCDAVLSRFAKKIKPARRLFTEFVLSQKGLGHRKEFHGAGCKDARIFGEDSFLNEVLQQAEEVPLQRSDLGETLKLVSGYFNRDVGELRLPGQSQNLSKLRAFAAWAVLDYSDATLADLGRWLDRDSSSLSSAVRRLREKAKSDDQLRSDMNALKEQLAKFAALQA
ncbi:MAG: transposase [Geopsychrobacter sp.]|nr:transposase [Geopsychrobacter sp.]